MLSAERRLDGDMGHSNSDCLSKYLEKWGRREITVSLSDHRQKVNDPADLETWETCRSQNNDSCTLLTRRERWLELQRFSTL